MGKKLTHEFAYEQIKKKITDGVWKKGDQIDTIKVLSEEMGIGVSSVREAIRILVNQKILIPEQGRGTFVANTSFDSTQDGMEFLGKATMLQLTRARLIIEPELAALACAEATSEEIELIVASAKEMDKRVKRKEDFYKSDMDFHYYIAKASKNDILLNMMNLISDLLRESRRNTMRIKDMDKKAAIYHMLIAESIANRNSEQARTLMKAHINDVLFVIPDLEE